MATNNTVTLTGGKDSTVPNGLIYDGKKTLTITNTYTAGTVSLGGTFYGLKEDKAGNPTVSGNEVPATKIGIVSVEGGNSRAYDITGSSKSTAIYLGTGGGTVRGGSAGDKFYGSTGADTFVVGSKDAVGDKNGGGFGSNDLLVLEGASIGNLTFTDNIKAGSVVIANNKDKVTVFKDSANTQLHIKTEDADFYYGVDGTKTAVADNGKTLKINSANNGDAISAATLLAGAKNIDATAVNSKNAIYLSGNGQNDNISIGAGGGTLYGGYNVKNGKNVSTNDNLYGTDGSAVTFYIDGVGGNDNIFNYKDGDTIVIDDGAKTALSFDSKGTQKFKDGGTGKDVSFTYNGKKIAIKANDAERIVFDINGTVQAYGPSLASGLSVDAKRTALIVDSGYAGTSVEAEGWTNGIEGAGADTNALKTYAPKLNTINATATTKAILLKAQDTIATVLQSGEKGSTMVGGTGADQFQGGAGADIYVVDLDNKKTTGKDVITAYDSNDIIMVRGLDASLENQVSVDTKGNVYFSTLKADQSKSAISVKNFKTAGTPVVVINEEGTVLAVNTPNGVPGPTGLNTTLKTGLQTDNTFNGKYNGAVAEGAVYNISTKKYNTTEIDDGVAVLDANTFGGTAKAINATLVSDSLRGDTNGLVIKGNASTKNTIYLPDIATAKNKDDLYVTVEGGTNNDTFIGHTTATATHAFYNISMAGKDVIENYNPDQDVIYLNDVTLKGIGESGYISHTSDSRIDEKNADVILTVNKNTLTIKNGATKEITFQDATGKTYTYGHTLPEGLAYDSKHTAINATGDALGEGADSIDLTETEPYSTVGSGSELGNYYAAVKTVSLSAAPETVTTGSNYMPVVIGNTLANEMYAAPGGSYLYGGDPGQKADADKLYGNAGVDAFVYKKGAGADAIGNTKAGNEKTLFDANDWLVLGSGNATALDASQLTFTDKKKTLTITYNGDKASKLTINKADADTAVKILFDNNSLSAYGHNNSDFSYNGYSDVDSDITSANTYFVYGVDTRTFRADASNIEKGTLAITGAGVAGETVTGTGRNLATVPVDVTIGVTQEDGSVAEKSFANVDVKYVSSGLKNIGVNNDDLVVSLVGGTTALNVSMGAGGGTVEGGENGTKAFNDKFYSKGNTTYVLSKATGGKDAIYNYNADNGDVLYFKDGAPTEVAFSAKSITFSYDGKKSTFTIYPPTGESFESSTNVKIMYPVVTNNQTVISSNTYYGWDAKQKSFSYYTGNVRDDQWTSPSDKIFIFHGKNTGENTGLYGTNYTLQGSSIIDADSNYIPDYTPDYAGINGEAAIASISFSNADATDTYIDPVFNGFHIKGTYQYNNGTQSTLKAGDLLTVNGTQYTLANVDGNVDNGYELTKNGWVKLADDSFAYVDPTKIYTEANNIKGASSIGSNDSPFTITGAISDAGSPGSANDVLGKLSVAFADSASNVTLAVSDSDVEISGSHVLLNSKVNSGGLTAQTQFKNSQNFHVTTTSGVGGNVVGVYKLYAGDDSTVNGYELLRTDIADAKHWTLETPNGIDNASKAKSSLQSGGAGFWQYSDTTASKSLVFEIGAAAGIKALANGLPDGISVGTVNANNETVNTTTIYFDNEDFNTANITLAADTKVGSETGAVHISGLAVGTQFTLGSGKNSTAYSIAEFDGDTSNGLELLKANDSGWTYDEGAWKYDNTNISTYSSSTSPALAFTISASASLQAGDDGTPKDVVVSSSTGGVFTIDFTGMSDAHVIGSTSNMNLTNKSDTSLITFSNIETGDVKKTVRIKGFDSDTAAFVINSGSFYLADLDSDTSNGYGLLNVHTNWKRTATGWDYYADGVAAAAESEEEVSATFSIDTLSNGNVMISADANGGPKGIKIEGNQFTIDERFGTISGANAKGETAGQTVSLTAGMIIFGADTEINSTGIHILGTSSISSVEFDAGTMVTVGEGAFKLANLDRDASNGYELLTTDTTEGWTFNNGIDSTGKAITVEAGKLGSWTFESDVKVGQSDALVFSVSEAASLLPVDAVAEDEESETVQAGIPGGIFVSLSGANASDATIFADSEFVASTQLIFTDATAAKALFLSDTGVHVIGFAEDDLVTVQGGGSYRVKELSNDAGDGFELLKVSDTDVWSLTSNEDNAYARDWTYTTDNLTLTVGHHTLGTNGEATVSFGGLYAQEDGRPINLSVTPGATSTDTATINVNQETGTTQVATLDAYSLELTTTQVGSGTSIHIVGYDSDTTLRVYDGTDEGGRAYHLANMDADTDTKELLAYNENWRYYDSDIQLPAMSNTTVSETFKAGTWIYTKAITENNASKTFKMALDSDVAISGTFGKSGSSTGLAAADANGAPIGVTVDGDTFAGLTITFDATALNIKQYNSTTKTTDTMLFSHITLGSDTKIGKEGIHISGFDSNTTLKVGDSDVYLVELDGDTSNGLELLKTNDVGWKRTATGWDYSSNTVVALGLSVATTLDADDTGAPIGITVNGGKSRENLQYSDTIVIDISAIESPTLLSFADSTPGGSSTGVHISLVGSEAADWAADAAFQFVSGTGTVNSTYYMKELDGDTNNGYELLIANSAGWSLENGTGTGVANRIWTYTNTANGEISFTVNANTKDGLKADPTTGLPIGASVTADSIGSNKNSAVNSYWLTFGDTDGTTGDSAVLSVGSEMLVFNSAVTGVNGIHIQGLAGSDTTDGSSFAYSTDTAKMFTVDGGQYYLANINSSVSSGTGLKTADYYELLYNDENWHRNVNGWKYGDGYLTFAINSDETLISATAATSTLGLILPASTVTADEGKPFGISVEALEDSNVLINITTAVKIADALVFNTDTTLIDNKLHISLSSANSEVTEFRVREYGTGEAPNTDTTYYIVDADHNAANGKEFYMKDTESDTGVWVRTADGWDYFNSGTNVTRENYTTASDFVFRLNISKSGQNGYSAEDAGQSVPAELTVATDTKTVTNANSSFDISQFQLYSGRFSTDVASDTTNNADPKVFTFSSPHFVGFEEGNTIASYSSTGKIDATYTLYNADGDSSNGLELTFDGWTSYKSGGDSTSTYHAYVRGTDGTHANNTGFAINVDPNVLKAASTNAATLPGLTEWSAESFTFSAAKNATQGVVLSALTSANFHVAQFSDVGVFASGTTVNLGNNTYMLKQLDGNANDFELTDEEGNWAKTSQNVFRYVGIGSETLAFTVGGGSTADYDNDNNFKPDFIDSVDSSTSFTISLNSTISGAYFELPSDTAINNVIVNYSNAEYTLAADGDASDSKQKYKLALKETEGSQFAANDAEAWSGYDVEDLINYDGGVTTDSELDSIIKPTEIGTAETFGTDPADLLTGVETKDKSLNALVMARHRARK